ncbi:MAG: peptidyl-prolyl cis-trans isomerase [Phycisphaeraceae bacterium]|nr:peptidyl-prolyl cis-trans isomerase [Phycisphaeraceae bacterium]
MAKHSNVTGLFSLLLIPVFVVAGCGGTPESAEGIRLTLSPDDFVASQDDRAERDGARTERPDLEHRTTRDAAARAGGVTRIGEDDSFELPDLTEPIPTATDRLVELDEEELAALLRVQRAEDGEQELLVQAMIGQVNARAIYASDVLEPEADRLKALSRQVSSEQFMRDASAILEQRLRLIVRDRLVLAEAMRELTDQEQQHLRALVERQRQELLRRHGQGSPTLADNRLREATGRGLEATLEQYRQAVILSRYRHRKMLPHVQVSRRDIERYYHENYEQFNPPRKVTVHMIRVTNANAARVVEEQLEEEPFKEVAANPINRNNPDREGLFAAGVSGQVFADERLNNALEALEPGQRTSRIEVDGEFFWIYSDHVEQPAARPFDGPVQLEIARLLEQRAMQYHWARYEARLMSEGNYASIESMTREVMRIVAAIYGRDP